MSIYTVDLKSKQLRLKRSPASFLCSLLCNPTDKPITIFRHTLNSHSLLIVISELPDRFLSYPNVNANLLAVHKLS